MVEQNRVSRSSFHRSSGNGVSQSAKIRGEKQGAPKLEVQRWVELTSHHDFLLRDTPK